MKNIVYLITSALFVLSCLGENKDTKVSTTPTISNSDSSQTIPLDSSLTESNVIEEETFINPEFLNLVKAIDSSGYLYDTIKLRKSYRRFSFIKIVTEGGYLFYETELKNTVPFTRKEIITEQVNDRAAEEMDSLELEKFKFWKSERLLDFKLLEKVKSIYSYHFIAKKPSGSVSRDGLIEQWEFDSKEDARKAAEDLGKKERFVYFNRGAYVCYLENYVYIFHSRSAGFYTPLKNFINLFVRTNKATTTKDSYGRCPY